MKMQRAVYGDPTGGGDDIVVTLPAWVEAPDHLAVYDRAESGSQRHIFDLEETEDTDEEDGL